MPYLSISDFKIGMDRTRPRAAGPAGSLWNISNAHLTRGGDVERAKKLVATFTLPEGTFGLGTLRGQRYVFGSASDPGVPAGVLYQQLAAPDTPNMERILSVTSFNGKLYVVARYDDGTVHHFYDGSRVSDLDAAFDPAGGYPALAYYMAGLINADPDVTAVAAGAAIRITARAAGTSFTIAVGEADSGGTDDQTIDDTEEVANVAGVARVRATGTVSIISTTSKITQVAVGSTDLLSLPSGPQGSGVIGGATVDAIATTLAQKINDRTSTHGYTAQAVGPLVTITAPANTGAGENAKSVTVTHTGTAPNTTAMAGGVTPVTAVAQVVRVDFGGTFEAEDVFTVTINGRTYTATAIAGHVGNFAFVYKQRVWSLVESLLTFSKLADPTDWTDSTTGTKAGSINIANENAGVQDLISIARYGEQLAVFALGNVYLFNAGTDPDDFALAKVLENTGTYAPRSVISYGSNDVFYLDTTGIRSLRSRDSTGDAFASDVGTAIDEHVQAYAATLTEDQRSRACSVIEPNSGRAMVSLGGRIYVFSHFPGRKISAWSYYQPGFDIDDMVRVGDQINVRSGDTIYLYGGASGTEYPDENEQVVTVEMPFLSANAPATGKMIKGVDVVAENAWAAGLLVDPNDENAIIDMGNISQITANEPHIRIPGRAALFALQFVCSAAGRATISGLQLHYDGEEQR